MRISRTPLRISFVGGGSDLPWFFDEEQGSCVAASIDKYIYVTYNGQYDDLYKAAYSQIETVGKVFQLQHELIRETLLSASNTQENGVEIHSIADIPGGTGLGSSSAFTVGLVRIMEPLWWAGDIAARAAHIEINRCNKAVGIQDGLVAAFGGINLYTFGPGHKVHVSPIECDYDTLVHHCLLFDTGLRRVEGQEAGDTLTNQRQDRESVRELASFAAPFAKALELGEMKMAGTILDAAWSIKHKFVSMPFIDKLWRKAKWEGAWGCKLCGAGGGGFFLVMAPPIAHSRIEQALGLRKVPIRLGVDGSCIIY